MNSIIKFSLKNKLAIWLLTIIIVIAGLYSGLNMKQEMLPNISTPVISISTVYPGASPDELSKKITNPIEQKITNLSGVEIVHTSSMANVSSIQIEYNYNTDMKEAVNDIKEAISTLNLPDGAQDPNVSRMSLNAFPVIALSATSDKTDLKQLTKDVEESLVPKLEGIDGVASVTISGQQIEEGKLKFNQKKLAQYGLNEETVKGIVQGSNVSSSLGIFSFSDTEKTIAVEGNISTLKDLKNIEIPVTSNTKSGTPNMGTAQNPAGVQGAQATPQLMKVKLSDVADIKIVGKAESISQTNGKDSIGLQITKSPDANTVTVVNGVKDTVKDFEKQVKGAKIFTTMDQGAPIEKSVSTMLNKALFGGLFAVIIILLFLRNIKTTIISIISIPLSLLMAILLLKGMNITLNIMTLGAMTVAIGRIVDDSIVVIENIYRRMSLKGETLKGGELIRSATKEMFNPILSSTVVTVAVYLPLATVGGPVGELFTPFALTMVFALLASLLVAITIVPSMAHALFTKDLKRKRVDDHRKKTSKLSNGYKKVLNWSLNHKFITFGIAILLLIGSLFLVPKIGVSFIPSDQQKMMMITYTPAPGELKENVQKETTKVEQYFMDKKDVDTVQYTVGQKTMMGMGGSNNSALFYVIYKDDTKNFDTEIEKVMNHLKTSNSAGTWKQQDMSGTGSSNELALNVYGNNVDEIKPVVEKIKKIMNEQKDLKDVSTSLSETYDQYTLSVNQQKLSDLGLTAGQIAMALSNTGSEEELTTIKNDGKEVKVYIEKATNAYHTKKDLENKTITSPLGLEVPLKDLVKIEEGKSSDTISTRDGKIYADVTATIKVADVSKVTADVTNKVKKIDLPASVTIDFGGVTQQITDSFTKLGLAMLAAIAIVYFVLVVTFHGGLAPIAILFSLPFTIIGALLGLFITGETISVSALMGVLMLIGIVVTNAIVLVDRVINKEEEGVSTREALLEAGATRIRPILMTALATVGALIPLAIGAEGSGLISKGLGVTVIGGILSSTLLTLVIVPVVYEFIMKFKHKKRVKREVE